MSFREFVASSQFFDSRKRPFTLPEMTITRRETRFSIVAFLLTFNAYKNFLE